MTVHEVVKKGGDKQRGELCQQESMLSMKVVNEGRKLTSTVIPVMEKRDVPSFVQRGKELAQCARAFGEFCEFDEWDPKAEARM